MQKLEMPRLTLAEHRRALVACRRCGYADGIAPITSLAVAPKAILVGQAPGQTEASGGKPFAGRAGKTLFRWFERAGMTEDQVRRRIYIAAITRCYPGPSPTGRGDRVPSVEEQQMCADWLEQELRIIRPKLLIPIGKLAIARFLPARPLDELIGRAQSIQLAGRTVAVIPLPHPSGASSWIHQGDHPALLDRALQLIAQALQ